jgi:hypothetical protein
MTRRHFISMAVVFGFAVIAGGSAVRAHEQYRMVGTLVQVEPARGATHRISIKFKWSAADTEEVVARVYVYPATVITRDGNKVPASELKVGLSVVVDATGDSWDLSDADSIRIVPPIKP